MFAVVDVETTGGYAARHKMTEIAVVVHDGIHEVQRFTSLLNPEMHIPQGIQALTGITPELVEDAPKFKDIADELRSVLADHIFVAHNVNFDFAFVKQAFEEVGITYNPKRLCSVRYTRQIEKGLRSYSLKNLCTHFGLENKAPHRAWGDAEVTAVILSMMLEKDTAGLWQHAIRKNSGQFNLPANLPLSDYQALPQEPGVYYFLGRTGKPIYIGKARNLRKRVASHFISDKVSKRSQAFKREIYNINFELTGSELVAGLLEDHEIRQYWPVHNRAQKQRRRRFGIYAYENQLGETCLAVNQVSVQQGFIREFYSVHEAHNWLHKQVEQYALDPSLCGFPYQAQAPDLQGKHQEGLNQLLSDLNETGSAYVLKTGGRYTEEDGFVLIADGVCRGFGFIPHDFELNQIEDITDFLQPLKASITTKSLIESALSSGRYNSIEVSGTLLIEKSFSNKATLSI